MLNLYGGFINISAQIFNLFYTIMSSPDYLFSYFGWKSKSLYQNDSQKVFIFYNLATELLLLYGN